MKNIPLFFLEISLVFLPAFVYGIPIVPTVPQELVPEKSFLDVPYVDDLSLLPEKLDAVVPTVPISKINIPIEPVEVPLTEKLLQDEKKALDVPAELNPQVQQPPLVDNVNLLPEKQFAVVASFLYIDNVQVVLRRKLLEKIITLLSDPPKSQDGVVGLPEKLQGIVSEQLSLVSLDSLPQVGEVEKLGEFLSPLAVIASIPQIGNIQLVFSGELIKNILSKKLISSVPVESKPGVVDDNVITLEEISPEKPFLLVPTKSLPEVDNVFPEKLEVVKNLPVVPDESKLQIGDVTVLPGFLEESVTEKSLLLVPGESALQTGNGELLDKLPSKELPLLVPDKSKLNIGNVVVLPAVVEQKPLPSVPVSPGHNGDVLAPVEVASGVVNGISSLLPAVPTFTPVLELSTSEKLPIASKE